MQLNVKSEIISSYEKLIKDCQVAIENNIDVKKNLSLINEYERILLEVQRKPENAYDGVSKEIERMSRFDFKKAPIEKFTYQEV